MKGRNRLLLVVITMAAAAAAAIVLYHTDRSSFLYFGDGVSHLTRARQFVDSRLPGLHNIGTVWLPLPHLLFLPLALVDSLFYTGIAAPMLGIPLLAATTVLLYSLIRRLAVSAPVALVCALAFGLNPNLVYMALTPMTEMFLLFFITLAALMFVKWEDGEGERYLVYGVAAVVCASLCRYEAWLCVPFVSLLALARARERARSSITARGTALTIAAAALVWAGIALWIGWNVWEYQDAFIFAHWTHSIATRTAPAAVVGRPFESMMIAGRAIRMIFGTVILAAAAFSLARLFRRGGADERTLVALVFLSLPGVFALASIYAGFAQIDQWRWNWRYMLTFSPFISVAASIGMMEVFSRARQPVARWAVALGVLAIPVIQIVMPERVGVSTYIDAKKGFLDETQFATQAGERLRQAEVSGSIALVTGYSQSQRIMITSRLPLRTFHYINRMNDEEFYRPLWPDEEYVVIGKQARPESRELVDYWLKRRSILLARYSVVWEDAFYLILKINPSRSSYQEPGRARR